MLATELVKIKGFNVNPDHVETNIVVFDVAQSGYSVNEVIQKLKEKGVLMVPFGATLVRAVTSLEVSRQDIENTIRILHELFKSDN